MNSLEIEKTGGTDNHKGDFIMKDNDTETWKETTCYIYMKNVPKTEFDTFKSDITKKML